MKNNIFCILFLIVSALPLFSQIDTSGINDLAIAKFIDDALKIERAMLDAEKVINAMQELLALQWWWGILGSFLLPIPVILITVKLYKCINIKRASLFQIYKQLNDGDVEKAKEILKIEYETKTPSKLFVWMWASASVIVLIGWVFLLGYSNVSA